VSDLAKLKSTGAAVRARQHRAVQVADAIGFTHEAGVIHGDLTCANIFVDAGLKARVADFAGSSIDGSPLLVLVIESHELPGSLLSTQADLFALGSVLYEIMTGQPPYKGLGDKGTRDLHLEVKFPEISTLGAVGFIIEQCWQTSYSGAEAVAEGLRGIPPTSAVEPLDKNAGYTPGKSP
jgi:serine/threonine protein kinase